MIKINSLYWQRDKNTSLEKDVRVATKRFHKRVGKEPTLIIFNSIEMVEYDGDLDVQFAKTVQKGHFKLVAK